MRELDAHLNSIQGKLDQLSNSTQTMWMHFMDSDVLKFLIDFATGVVKLTDKIGLLNAVVALFAAKSAFSSDSLFRWTKLLLPSLDQYIVKAKEAKVANQEIAASTKALSIAGGLLNSVLTAGVSLLAGWAIGAFISHMDDVIHKTEKAAEAAVDALNTYKDTQKTLNDQSATIEELSNSYEKLSKGVNTLDNENVNLSTDAYQEYLNVCNDIADMYPNLVTGFDEQGNAILSLKGNVDQLTQSYLDAAQAHRQALIAEGDNVFESFKNNYDSYSLGVFNGDSTGMKQQIQIAEEFIKAAATDDKDVMQELYDKYSKRGNWNDVANMFETAGIDESDIVNFEFAKGNVVDVEAFKEAARKLLSFIKTTKVKMNTEANGVKTLMDAYLGELYNEQEYAALTEEAKSAISTIVSNLDADFINKFDDAGSLVTWIVENIVDSFNDPAIGKALTDSVSGVFDLQSSFQDNEITLGDYKRRLTNLINNIKTSGLNEDLQEQLLQMFNIDLEKDDSLGEEVDTMVNHTLSLFDESFKEQAKGKVLELSYADLQLINSSNFKVDAGTFGSWQQLLDKIKETKVALTQDFTVNDFAEYAESISSIQENISVYQEALEKLESGKFTMSDFVELIAQFPDLAAGVDVNSKSFNGLAQNLRLAMRAAPDDLVDELKELKKQLEDADKDTDNIDTLINSLQNLPADTVASLADEYSTLADQISEAEAAQNRLKESMSEDPNVGYETRAEAIDQMKTLMEEGRVGSESELWDIAKEFGFTYDTADSIEANTKALYDFILAREKWYALDEDGKDTYDATKNFIQDAEKAAQSAEFKNAMKESGLDPSSFKWDMEGDTFAFDFDNANWDEIVNALSQTKDLAGITSEEFADLLVQIGQFFEIKWGDADDVTAYISKISEGEKTVEQKTQAIQTMSKVVEGYVKKVVDLDEISDKLDREIDFDNLTQADINAIAGADEALKNLLETYVSLKNTLSIDPDPLGLSNAQTTVESLNTELEKLGVAAEQDDTTKEISINVTELETALDNAGWTQEAIDAYVAQITGGEIKIGGFTVKAIGAPEVDTSETESETTEVNVTMSQESKDVVDGVKATEDIFVGWKDKVYTLNLKLNDDGSAAIESIEELKDPEGAPIDIQINDTGNVSATDALLASIKETYGATGIDVPVNLNIDAIFGESLPEKIKETVEDWVSGDLNQTISSFYSKASTLLGLENTPAKEMDSNVRPMSGPAPDATTKQTVEVETVGKEELEETKEIADKFEEGSPYQVTTEYVEPVAGPTLPPSVVPTSTPSPTATSTPVTTQTVNVNLEVTGAEELEETKELADSVPEEKQTEYNMDGDGKKNLKETIKDWLKMPTNKTTTYTIYKKTVNEDEDESDKNESPSGGGTGGSKQTFLAMVNGSAHAQGTAFASGSWGLNNSEDNALVGELGEELIVDTNTGRYYTVGTYGAEFVDIPKNSIVFNHKQTESLLKNGYVTGRGKAYASGTAFASGGGSYAGNQYTFSDTESSNKNNSSSSDDAKDEFEEIFDWIAVRLEEITKTIDLKTAQLENVVGSTKQNAVIDDMLDLHKKLYTNLTAGANTYYSFAEKLLSEVPAQYRAMAKDGSIAIETFAGEVGEEQLEAIEKYREWVQKGNDATQQAEETLTEISNLAKQAIDNITAEFENKASIPSSTIDQLEAYNALLETTMGAESENVYSAMIKANNESIKILQQQRNKMQAELDEQVTNGNIEKYSQNWYDAINEIAAVDTEIINLTADTNNYQDSVNDLHWDTFDNLLGRFEAISNEASNLIDILGNEDLVDKDTAEWTDAGITSLGLYAQQMEIAELQSQKCREEIDYLNKNWKKLGYTEQEYVEKLEELKEGQYDSIKLYEDTKQSIVDLNKVRVDAIKDGIQKEIDAYTELIEKKKEELSSEKDLVDFQKSIAESNKNIEEIRRKIAALSSDDSASARAQRARLQAELAEAQAELEEKFYDRSVENQQKALDDELSHFQEVKNEELESWDEYLEDVEVVVSDSLATIQANTDVVYQTLASMGQEYSLSIAESITSPWREGETAVQSFSEKFGLSMSVTVEELKKLENEFKATMREIEQEGIRVANTVQSNMQQYQAAENVYTTVTPSTTVGSTPSGGGSSGSFSSGSSGSSSSSGLVSSISGNIKNGQRGTNVSKLQQALNELGFNCGNVDGIFGSKTLSAVKSFQRSSKYGGAITADGIVGTNTKKKFKTAGYASGTLGVKKNQFATIDELGEELVIRPSNGRMTFLEKGTGVLPADLTANLMEWGALNPQSMIDQNRPAINVPGIVNNNIELNLNIGEVVHIDSVSNDTIPDLTKAIDKQLDKYMKNLNAQIRKYVR